MVDIAIGTIAVQLCDGSQIVISIGDEYSVFPNGEWRIVIHELQHLLTGDSRLFPRLLGGDK